MSFLNINDRAVGYRLLGDPSRPLVVLAHPLGMTQAVWDDLLPELLPRYRVLSWDLPGHGSSAAWRDERITPAALAEEVLALVEMAGGGRFHFVGTSIGGVIGQQLLSTNAGRLLSATLTNTGAVIGTAEAWQARAGAVRENGLAVMANEIVPRWFGPLACEREPALQPGWSTIMGRGNANSYALLCEMLGASNFSEQLKEHDVSLLLVGGRDDVATPPESLEHLACCAGADAPVILEQVGHVPSVEAPAQFAELLLKHIG
ncbi:alpha/beta fold hydrolase [Oceanimonas baumannii]|uniref:3-oxoadipate enol-lactonase/3-oxoadipate enol-lactonase/4-carboxymuconolactone decarboxylase n=1 Tax=Oceanimonas baumannii TaxID=129578 RepID=A0A235CH22_9GAMM|nr:alpha/beta fold hydrolase [Oceanimonas baumannii]OYD23684.1 3-oxoadipate enol-lactone hydrolase [Oceanimonas baumannii]TDW55881.1 3-oxoadipate enol-lactonase/3-oxoadipate enol-lactonase/4-carboxymuconolactone decarboxylase [Oceanimonas baumannii]